MVITRQITAAFAMDKKMHEISAKNAAKWFLLKVLFVLSSACGQVHDGEIERNIDCLDGCSKQVEPDAPVNTTTVVAGTPGRDGKSVQGPKGDSIVGPRGERGKAGVSGDSCTILDTSYGADITCGSEVVSIFDGSDGIAGIAGQSCSVVDTLAGATITCGLDSVAIADGENGADAPMAISEVYDPCGNGPGPDEVVLIFATGEWVAWYVDLGLSILTPGAWYQTTDQQACTFQVPL
jgi:hypothetical protein